MPHYTGAVDRPIQRQRRRLFLTLSLVSLCSLSCVHPLFLKKFKKNIKNTTITQLLNAKTTLAANESLHGGDGVHCGVEKTQLLKVYFAVEYGADVRKVGGDGGSNEVVVVVFCVVMRM